MVMASAGTGATQGSGAACHGHRDSFFLGLWDSIGNYGGDLGLDLGGRLQLLWEQLPLGALGILQPQALRQFRRWYEIGHYGGNPGQELGGNLSFFENGSNLGALEQPQSQA